MGITLSRIANRNITFNGITQCVTAWEKELGFEKDVLGYRIRHGWLVAKALTTPSGNI